MIWWIEQEGAAEEDLENKNEEDGEPIETEEKEDAQPVERPRKTSKYMTKYERARILGTRALQIRFPSVPFRVLTFVLLIVCDAITYCFFG